MPNFEDSNARTIWIVDALKSAVQDSSYQVLLPWLHPSTWDSVASPVDSIRNGLKFAGRRSLGYCLLLAFFDVASGPEAGCLPGHYETVEECLLREDVLVEILLKLRHPGVAPIATRGSKVRDPFLVFVGGLWQDTQNLGKVLPFVIQIFVPLIRVAMRAYNEFRPDHFGKKHKRARVSESGASCAGELRILHRIRDYQFARKPVKPRKLVQLDSSPGSSAAEEEVEDDKEFEGDEELDDNGQESSSPVSSSSLSTAGRPWNGRGKTRPWTSAFTLPVQAAALLPPFAPESNARVIEDKPSEREETGVAGPPRSPLTPRNLKVAHGSGSPSASGARATFFPDRSSSPPDCPSTPASLVSSFKENMLLG